MVRPCPRRRQPFSQSIHYLKTGICWKVIKTADLEYFLIYNLVRNQDLALGGGEMFKVIYSVRQLYGNSFGGDVVLATLNI